MIDLSSDIFNENVNISFILIEKINQGGLENFSTKCGQTYDVIIVAQHMKCNKLLEG